MNIAELLHAEPAEVANWLDSAPSVSEEELRAALSNALNRVSLLKDLEQINHKQIKNLESGLDSVLSLLKGMTK